MLKNEFIRLLRKNLGNVSAAAREAFPEPGDELNEKQEKALHQKRENARRSHYVRMQADETYRSAVDELNNIALDFAEGKLFQLMNEMNPTAIIFFLKTKGKGRGYIEKSEMELTGKDGEPLQTTVVILPSNEREDKNNE